MGLLTLLHHSTPPTGALPEFIRDLQDIRGVRVIRLRGPVGKDIGAQEEAAVESAAKTPGVFSRPLLFDFEGTTGWDFSTVSYLVQALRHRMAAHAQVGIIHPSPELLAELHIAKLEGLFRVFGSEEEAIGELASNQRPDDRSPPRG
jgi:hypothetical protein